MHKEVSLEDILYTINKWRIESQSKHNDGWVTNHYLDNIHKIEEALNVHKEPKLIT
tara:strand:+ start:573 stop:740 length:168 start_codon:yes stop_codon:yes gene_type:complete